MFDWLFDRINLDPKIQIKYIDTKNQLADMLTKGNFTRDEWNHLLCLFNISHFSSTVCSEAMAKRVRQDSGEEKSQSEVEANDESYCEGMEVRVLGVRNLRKMIERGNPLSTVTCTLHATQGGMMTKLGLLKSGKLTNKTGQPAVHAQREARNGIRIVIGIQIILEQGERSSAKKTKNDLQ